MNQIASQPRIRLGAHRWLHEELPVTEEMFERWLEILDTTLDTGWRGPRTEQVRRRGYGLAWAMAHRLAGVRLALWVPETRPWSLTCRDAGRC